MNYIIDLVILLFILLLVFHGANRGLVMTLCGLVAIIVAFVGASISADYFSPAVTELVEPHISNIIEAELGDAFDTAGDSALLEATLKDFGFYDEVITRIDDAVGEHMDGVSTTVVSALSQIVSETLAHLCVFLISFAIILLVWAMVSRALDLVARLPILNEFNTVGGAILGFIKACLFLFVLAWLVQYLGQFIPESTVRSTILLKFFMETNPMTLLF